MRSGSRGRAGELGSSADYYLRRESYSNARTGVAANARTGDGRCSASLEPNPGPEPEPESLALTGLAARVCTCKRDRL